MITEESLKIKKLASSRVPTAYGAFQVHVYAAPGDNREHIALVKGDVRGKSEVLTRLHSECFTGDVLGSRRCDCGEQLRQAMGRISQEQEGIILYLRQEGRGIGLVGKMRAYNLQDIGFDTVDANLLLGYRVDQREYSAAARILQDLHVSSIRLLTNNLSKIEGLRKHGITVTARLPLMGTPYPENLPYLTAKMKRMNHLISPGVLSGDRERNAPGGRAERPYVTLCYAQSIDGCIASVRGQRLPLSGPESLAFVHGLRAEHDAILVGIGTVLSDNPRLTVRLVEGRNPQPVILDTHLRFPPDAYLLTRHPRPPWIAAGRNADAGRREALEKAGARVIPLPTDGQGVVDLRSLLSLLAAEGIERVMVEGGARVITNFLFRKLVDRVVLTISPVFVGGVPAFSREDMKGDPRFPALANVVTRRLGKDMIVQGEPEIA